MVPFHPKLIEAYAVSRLVNDPKNDSLECKSLPSPNHTAHSSADFERYVVGKYCPGHGSYTRVAAVLCIGALCRLVPIAPIVASIMAQPAAGGR
jgi:hypothetical protein